MPNNKFKLVSVSGGKSSMMLCKILSDNGVIDDNTLIAFANTGLEHEETLKFIHTFETVFKIPVTWLEYTKEKPFFKIVDFETASRDGQPFRELLEKRNYKYLPNIMTRFCTGDLKIKTIRRFIRSIGIKGQFDTYLGLRFDEKPRVAKKRLLNSLGKDCQFYIMPLDDMRITKKLRDVFWESQPFQLGIPDRYGNCVGCFMKGANNLMRIFKDTPQYADFFKESESKVMNKKRKRNGQFHKEWSYNTLLELTESQLEIKEFEYQGIDCSCTD